MSDESSCCGPGRAGGHDHAPERGDPVLHTIGRPRPVPVADRLVAIGAATLSMGSEDRWAYPGDGEGPVRRVEVAPFRISATAVSVAEFARFVVATGHVTDAEQFGDSLVFVGLLPDDAPPTPAVAATPWWRQVAGASWRAPEGPGSGVEGREDHPVTHVSHRDALAYAAWSGTRLPTEAEWELAARGGLEQQPFPWGADLEPSGERRMKVFQGRFPDAPTEAVGTVPVDSYAPNGLGLHNATGNVWEWTASPWSSFDPRPVLRGGSYLCHASYCRRYRTSARTANTPDTSLGHTGFRVAV